MKATLYVSYAARSLGRGGQRSIFAVFCIAVGVLAIVALQLVSVMISASLTTNIRAINGADVAVHSEGSGLSSLQVAYFASLKAQGIITDYTAVPSDGANGQTSTGLVRFDLWPIDPSNFPLAGAPQFITPASGSLPTVLTGDQVVITRSLQEQLGVSVGGTLSFTTDSGRTANVTIAGEVADTGLFTQPLMLMAFDSYQALPSLSGAPISYTWVFVNVPGDTDAASASVAQMIRQHLPLVTADTVQTTLQKNEQLIADVRIFLQVIGLLALLIGGIGIINTMQVLLRRRQLEIAMLKTVGYRQRDLLALFGLEAAMLGLAGGVIGAAAGAALSTLVRVLVERAIFLDIPLIIDPLVVASGVAIGIATTLIFGLLPIVQASRTKPIAVLRETREGGNGGAAGLLALLAGLFFVLALSILQNVLVALAVIAGTAIIMALMTGAFTALAWLISRLPVPEARHVLTFVPLALVTLVAIPLVKVAPGFGIAVLFAAAIGWIVALLPRPARLTFRLALRNIGRQPVRTATTLIALFGGVFAIGFGLALGQGIQDALANVAAQTSRYNTFILVGQSDRPAVDRTLAQSGVVQRETVSVAAPDLIVSIDGVPLSQIVPGSAKSQPGQPGSPLSGVDGIDLASNPQLPVSLAQGLQDSQIGRNLTPQDAGTTNALLPLTDTQAPLKLKLGDAITVTGLDRTATVTLRVVGFYDGSVFSSFAPVLADISVANTLSLPGRVFVIYALNIDPSAAYRVVTQVKDAVPTAVAISVAAELQAIAVYLANVIVLIESVAALALLAGMLMIGNAVALAMLERRREMGILKSVGHTSGGILSGVLVENGAIGLTGALLAVALVAIASLLFFRLLFRFKSPGAVSPALELALIAGTAVLAMLIATLVAWRATRVRPIEVLRYE